MLVINEMYKQLFIRIMYVMFSAFLHCVTTVTLLFIQYEAKDLPNIKAGSRIGWTYEKDFDPISFDYRENHTLYFRKIENDVYPVVSKSYKFQELNVHAAHSIAVNMRIGA